jgi:hypothetical protein
MHLVAICLIFVSVANALNYTRFPTSAPTFYDPPKPPSPIWGILTMVSVFFSVVFVGIFSFGLFWYFDPELRQNLNLSHIFGRKEENYQKLSSGDGAIEGDSSSDAKFNLSDFDEDEDEYAPTETAVSDEASG